MSDEDDTTDNVIPFPQREPEEGQEARSQEEVDAIMASMFGAQEPQLTLAEVRQNVVAKEVAELLQAHRGDVTAIGGIVRRQDLSNIVGYTLTEEEFDAAAQILTDYALKVISPVLTLLINEGVRQARPEPEGETE